MPQKNSAKLCPLIRKLDVTDVKPGRKPNDGVDKVMATCHMRGVLRRSTMTVGEIDSRYCQKSPTEPGSGLPYKWLRGDVLMGNDYVELFEADFRGSAELLKWIVWPLFRQRWHEADGIANCLYVYVNPDHSVNASFYKFPGDPDLISPEKRIKHSLDTDAMLQRNDHYGFMALLSLVRYAEAANLPIQHSLWSVYLLQAFPGFVRHPDLYDSRHALLDLTIAVIVRRLAIMNEFAVDAEMLMRHVESGSNEIPSAEFVVPYIHIPERNLPKDAMRDIGSRLIQNMRGDEGILPAVAPARFKRTA